VMIATSVSAWRRSPLMISSAGSGRESALHSGIGKLFRTGITAEGREILAMQMQICERARDHALLDEVTQGHQSSPLLFGPLSQIPLECVENLQGTVGVNVCAMVAMQRDVVQILVYRLVEVRYISPPFGDDGDLVAVKS